MRSVARMLMLGVMALSFLGATEVGKPVRAADTGVSEETLRELDAAVEKLFEKSRDALEEAGVPHSDSDAGASRVGALGVSSEASMPGENPLPAIILTLGVGGGVAILAMAFRRQYYPLLRAKVEGRETETEAAKEEKMAENEMPKPMKARRSTNIEKSRALGRPVAKPMVETRSHHKSAREIQNERLQNEFAEISKAVDEIMAARGQQQ